MELARPGGGPSVGIAVGREFAVAVVRAGKEYRTVSTMLPGPPDPEAAAGVLAAAFADLRDRLTEVVGTSAERASVHVALMPPLSEVRLLELPPLKSSEARIIIQRNASRYFLGAGQRVIGVRPSSNGKREKVGAAETLAMGAAAPAALVEAVFAAARATGWKARAVVPAQAAWLALSGRAGGGKRSVERSTIVAVNDQTAHVLSTEGGEPRGMRRVPADSAAITEAAGTAGGDLVLLAPSDRRSELARNLAAQGWIVRSDSLGTKTSAEVAALMAGKAALELTPASIIEERRQTANRLALRLAAAAVVLLAATVGLEFWGLRRELQAVRAERAAIAAEVAPLLLLQDSVARLNARVQAVAEVANSTPSYTRALLDIALLLPRDAHVTALQATGDTLTIQAVGARAGDAIEALREASSLRDVRLRGIIERELEAGTTAIERFTVMARLAEDLEEGATSAAIIGSEALAASDAGDRARTATGGGP